MNDSQWDDISHALAEMEDEVMGNMIGLILPHALASISGLNVLACDGTIYNRVDYPRLYAALDPIYIIDADTFRVPDMRDKFPMSEGDDFSLDDTGGEQNHLLSVAEMPLHSHTNDPHFHTESAAAPAVGAAITGVPVPSAIPSGSVTSSDSISIHNTGGDEPHNNMPPYIALRWVMVSD